jgi:hypothetical protein
MKIKIGIICGLFTLFAAPFGATAHAATVGLGTGSNMLAIVVPEPASLSILAVGAAALLLRRGRR